MLFHFLLRSNDRSFFLFFFPSFLPYNTNDVGIGRKFAFRIKYINSVLQPESVLQAINAFRLRQWTSFRCAFTFWMRSFLLYRMFVLVMGRNDIYTRCWLSLHIFSTFFFFIFLFLFLLFGLFSPFSVRSLSFFQKKMASLLSCTHFANLLPLYSIYFAFLVNQPIRFVCFVLFTPHFLPGLPWRWTNHPETWQDKVGHV